jgi:predicted DCC family thiol-disulfide oxidoreductase YuxK
MCSYAPFLLSAADWDLFARLANRRPRRITAYFDASCGVCFQSVRVWARLDRFERIRFVSSLEAPEEVSPELLRHTLLVVDEQGRRWTRADAVAQILRALPVGWLWSLPLRLPGLRQVANAAYSFFSRRRERISTGLRLSPVEPADTGLHAVAKAAELVEAPVRSQLRRLVTVAREVAAAAMLITMVSETLFINQAVPKFLKHEQPLWIKRLVAYPRFIQAWSMFASDAPMTDENLVVDAMTIDGRHVDPYSQVAGRYPDPGRNEIPVRMDNDSLIFNYTGRIPDNPAYHQALTEWILRYHERTGKLTDQIVKFDCYHLTDDSPPIGELKPRNLRTRLFLSYPPKH